MMSSSKLELTIECVQSGDFQRTQNGLDYCLLYYPGNKDEVYCPFLIQKSYPVQLGEGVASVTLDYWLCTMDLHTSTTRRKVVKNLIRKLT
jgi:hypothetical protein